MAILTAKASGGDADDEDFFITIKFDIFAKPDIDPTIGLADVSFSSLDPLS